MHSLLLRISTLLFLLLMFSTLGASQERELSEQEFEKVESDAQKLSTTSNRRTVMDSKHVDKASPAMVTLEIREVSERTVKGDWRSIRVEKGKNGTKETANMSVGGVDYVRTADGRWLKKEKVKDQGRFSVFGDPAGRKEERFQYAYLGKVELAGIKLDLYESRKFRSYQLRPDWNHSYTTIERLWLSPDGKLAKRQSQTAESDGHISVDTVWAYEYPGTLIIEAPIK